MAFGNKAIEFKILLLTAIFCLGCDSKVELYNRLDEQSSEKIIKLLNGSEIPVSKINNGDGSYQLFIDSENSASAFEIISKIGQLNGKIKIPEIIVPGSNTDKVLTDKILAEELEKAIERFPQVLFARIIISTNNNDRRVTAILVRKKDIVWSEELQKNIKDILKNSVETVNEPLLVINEDFSGSKFTNQFDQVSNQFGIFAKSGTTVRVKSKLIFTFLTVFILGLGCGVLLAYRRMAKKYGNIRRNN